MKKRPTIQDLAQEAGVSIATVNRVLSGSAVVSAPTVTLVHDAARRIGYHGVGSIAARRNKALPQYRLGFLLQQKHRDLYRLFGEKIVEAVAQYENVKITTHMDYVDNLDPPFIAARLETLAQECDCVAIVAADHPLIGQMISKLALEGKPVVTYISDQSAPQRAAYIGTDNWKLGRTAGFLIAQILGAAARARRVAVFIGNHRYQCQDMAEAGFRSYMREFAPHLTLEDSKSTNEEADQAYDLLKNLLKDHEDLSGVLMFGGGASGLLRALREEPEERQKNIKLICRDIGRNTRLGLSQGLITALLCHPIDQISKTLIDTMIEVINNKKTNNNRATQIMHAIEPFVILTPENI